MLPCSLLFLLLLPGLSANSTSETRIEAGTTVATREVTTTYVSKTTPSRSDNPTTSTAGVATTEIVTSTSLRPIGISGETSTDTLPSLSKEEFKTTSAEPTAGTVGSSPSTSKPLDVTVSNSTPSRETSSTSSHSTSVILVTSNATVASVSFASSTPASTPNMTQSYSSSSSVATSPVSVITSSTAGNVSTLSTNTSGTADTTANISSTEKTTSKLFSPTIASTSEKVPSVASTSLTANKNESSAKSMTSSVDTVLKETPKGLSSGAIAAITVIVIAVVLLVFGGAAYLKIRHSSYGRLLDDHDYGSWGNYNNPLYDDS